jgi:hypothetical protein
MPRPKKVAPIEETLVLEETLVQSIQEDIETEKPPTQVLVPFFIKKVVEPEELDSDEILEEPELQQEEPELQQENVSFTKFQIYFNGEFVETVDDGSSDLIKYLELNRAELDERIHELWQTPNDPNDLIFFNFGEQKMNYNSYNAYFNVNGFAPIEPRIKSWMEYYLNKHNPITSEEIAIQLKGPLQYSFIPIKS